MPDSHNLEELRQRLARAEAMGAQLSGSMIILAAACLSLICISSTSAQESADFQGRIAYEHRVDEDSVEVVYYENASKNSFPIEAADCYEIPTINREIQSPILLVSQQENPHSLIAYDMFTSEIVFQREWESSWIPCSFRWLDGYMALVIAESYDYSRLDADGNILDTVTAEEAFSFPIGVPICGGPRNLSCDEVEALIAQWIPDYPDGHTVGIDEYYPFYGSRFSPYIVISVHLDENQNIVENGQGNRYTVLFNVETGEIIEVLENAPLVVTTSRFYGLHTEDFAWSYSGQYLFYVSDYVMVYDLAEDSYPVEIELSNEYSSADITRTTLWSADNRYVAFSLDTQELATERFIGAVDVSRQALYLSELSYEISPYILIMGNLNVNNLVWLSGQFQLAWVSPEHELIIYDVETDTTSVLDENVVWVIGS